LRQVSFRPAGVDSAEKGEESAARTVGEREDANVAGEVGDPDALDRRG
jgi:hypothetical protein